VCWGVVRGGGGGEGSVVGLCGGGGVWVGFLEPSPYPPQQEKYLKVLTGRKGRRNISYEEGEKSPGRWASSPGDHTLLGDL